MNARDPQRFPSAAFRASLGLGIGSARDWLLAHQGRIIQAVRMTVASLVTFVLADALGLPQNFWAVITALIVTQSSVGGSLKAAADRFAGPVFGAVYGGAVAFAIPHQGSASTALALIVAIAPLSLAAAFSAGFRIAPITAIIVLLSTSGSSLGPLAFAFDRILEVGLGCAVGLLISLLVVPARASRAVLRTAAEIVNLLADQLVELAPLPEHDAVEASGLPLRTRKALNRLEALVGEAQRERRSRLTSAPDPAPLLPHAFEAASRCGGAQASSSRDRAR